ncbi:hypothetical protein Hanom_Chr12g01075851 [Helianthus anomalus]
MFFFCLSNQIFRFKKISFDVLHQFFILSDSGDLLNSIRFHLIFTRFSLFSSDKIS